MYNILMFFSISLKFTGIKNFKDIIKKKLDLLFHINIVPYIYLY